MSLKHRILLFLSVVIFKPSVRADVLFEGLYKITSNGSHIGYSIQRYEFDARKKQFVATTFLKTSKLAGNITESLKAYAKEDLTPVSYQFTSLDDTGAKTIDAQFDKDRYLATVKQNGKVQKISQNLKKGVFLSNFLIYTILKSKQGFKIETKYDYFALAEEDGTVYPGAATVLREENYKNQKSFVVSNQFKDVKFTSYVTGKGEILASKSTAPPIESNLVVEPQEALSGMELPSQILRTLFGELPYLSQSKSKSESTTKKPNLEPAKKGIVLKAKPVEPEPDTTTPAPSTAPKKEGQ